MVDQYDDDSKDQSSLPDVTDVDENTSTPDQDEERKEGFHFFTAI